jgi:hypothetical protein
MNFSTSSFLKYLFTFWLFFGLFWAWNKPLIFEKIWLGTSDSNIFVWVCLIILHLFPFILTVIFPPNIKHNPFLIVSLSLWYIYGCLQIIFYPEDYGNILDFSLGLGGFILYFFFPFQFIPFWYLVIFNPQFLEALNEKNKEDIL